MTEKTIIRIDDKFATQKIIVAAVILLIFFDCRHDVDFHPTVKKQDCGSLPYLKYNRNPVRECISIGCAKCKYIVKESDTYIDGSRLNLQPGDTICLTGKRSGASLLFNFIVGSKDQPITVINCGESASISVADDAPYAMKFMRSKYFRVTGSGTADHLGVRISGGALGLSLDYLSSDFEIDHLEVSNIGFAGIIAKTDPSCDSATHRGKFIMQNISIHHNFVHDVGGEAFYIGNSFYTDGVKVDTCNVILPHELENIRIFNNFTKNTGREGIQLGCATSGAEIFDNRVEDFGQSDMRDQNNGIQIGDGTGGLCYNNFVFSGKGNGIIALGIGNNKVFNNVIFNAGGYGIFCDDRHAVNGGFSFINNTIVKSSSDGIRLYSNGLHQNSIINNLVAEPGSFGDESYGNVENAFIFIRDTAQNTLKISNLFLNKASQARFERASTMNFDLGHLSPAIDAGKDVSSYGITFDFLRFPRPLGDGFDIGAYETQKK